MDTIHEATSDLTSPWFVADPGPTLDRLRDDAPVAYHEPLGAWVLTRYRDVSDALARTEPSGAEHVTDDASLGAWLALGGRTPRGPLQTRLEAALSPARLRAARPGAEALAAELVARLERRTAPFDLVPELIEPLVERATARFVGIPEAEMARIAARASEVVAGLGALGPDGAILGRARKGLVELTGDVGALLERARRAPGSDLAAALVDADGAGSVPPPELAAGATGFVVGALALGREVVGHAVLALLTHPDAFRRVGLDPSLAGRALDEALRYNGPLLCVMRRTREVLDVSGRTIGPGERVACMVYAANRDPAVYDSPGRFDLDRRAPAHLGLGTVTPCPRHALTLLLAEVAVAALARRMPLLGLTGPSPRGGTLAVRRLVGLRVKARPSARLGGAAATYPDP